jgi:hypothetical protein
VSIIDVREQRFPAAEPHGCRVRFFG